MDLFVLDKIVIAFIQKLLTDPFTQFSVIAGIGAVVSAIFPDKSKDSRSNKK